MNLKRVMEVFPYILSCKFSAKRLYVFHCFLNTYSIQVCHLFPSSLFCPWTMICTKEETISMFYIKQISGDGLPDPRSACNIVKDAVLKYLCF